MNADTTTSNTSMNEGENQDVSVEARLETTDLGSAAMETKGGPVGFHLDGFGGLQPY